MSKDNAEVLAKLDQLTGMVAAEFAKIYGELAKTNSELAKTNSELAETNARLASIDRAQAEMKGRLDEQSRILAAMIPTTLAAVPARNIA